MKTIGKAAELVFRREKTCCCRGRNFNGWRAFDQATQSCESRTLSILARSHAALGRASAPYVAVKRKCGESVAQRGSQK
jgi:hypothetical protein